MKSVGDHLRNHALKLASSNDEDDADKFARTAYQRYYYACFLLCRTLLHQLENRDEIEHAALPQRISRMFQVELKNEAKKQYKAGVLKGGDYSVITAKSQSFSCDLCRLLDTARALRTVADYHPDNKVVFSGNTCRLNGTKISDATHWPDTVNTLCGQLKKCWEAVYGQ